MPFFKFRKGGDAQPAPAPAPESVEALRRRARHRLIGAAVLVLMGVIGFPLVFDNQPRPIDVDIPIEIPDRNKVKPLGAAPAPAPSAQASGAVDAPPAATAAATPSAPASAAPAARVATGVVSPAPAAPKVAAVEAAKPAPKPEPKPVEKPAEKVAEKPAAKPDDGAKARALLDGKEAAAKPANSASAAATGRFVVQVGAYAEVTKAREARMKVERAGLKTYTQVVQSSEGKRIRVRVGPFENKAAADKAADKIKKLDLPAAILEL